MTPSERKEFNRIKRKLKRNNISSYKNFKKKYPEDYEYSVEFSILHELPIKGKAPGNYWNLKSLHKEAKKYETRADFQYYSRGAYSIAQQRLKILDQICGHMTRRVKWTKEAVLKEAKKYKTIDQLHKKSNGAYRAAKKFGIMEQIRKNMVCGIELNRKWTKKEILKEAKKYKTRAKFHLQSPGAYSAAIKRGILEAVCSHMVSGMDMNRKWTKEAVLKEAKKYKGRYEFKRKSISAYRVALKMEIMDKVCSHMEPTVDLREKKYQNKLKNTISKLLEKLDTKFSMKEEVAVGKKCRIDILLKLIEFDIIIPIEIKHGESIWSNCQIEAQINRYNKLFEKKDKYTKAYVVSPKGKYGYSEKEFLGIIKHLIKKEELYAPCAVV